MIVQPYLHFEGRCDEAIEFYKQAVDAKVDMLMRYKDSPVEPMEGCTPQAGFEDKVMHSAFRIGETMVMATDGFNTGKTNFSGFSLSLTCANDAEAKKRFDALADGGQVTMPLSKTFFTSSFGMLTDKFGVNWMVLTMQQ
jgi:PhnB protein